MRVRRLALSVLLPVLAGCQSAYVLDHEARELVQTEVVVRSAPEGAEIRFDGRSFGPAPLRMPIEYDHTEQLYLRQTNFGADMREGMSGLTTVLTFPVWAVASLFHHKEELRRHVYGRNEFAVTASLPGRPVAERRVKLEGEDVVEVELELR